MPDSTISWYNKNAKGLSVQYDEAEVAPLHSLLRRWIPLGGKVLDIGCGSGRDAFFLASLGCLVVAVDGSDSMLDIAQKKLSKEKTENILFQPALFPLPEAHPLFAKKFDAITAIAVLMHIPDDEIFAFACQVKTLLVEKGIFLCSFSSGEGHSKDDRLYEHREPGEIQLLFERIGFRLLFREETKDGMGRDIVWSNLVFSSEGKASARPVSQIESIVNRDRKSATYKFALLRALCEIAQKSPHIARWHSGDLVSIPIGRIVEKWLYYYWPLIDSEVMIPQLRGQELRKPIIFRAPLGDLIRSFAHGGGLSAFHEAFRSGKLLSEQTMLLRKTINSIAKAIIDGPVKYAGGSLDGDDSFFTFNGRRSLLTSHSSSDPAESLGRISLKGDVWREFCILGHWIGEGIILRWAELVHNLSLKTVPVSLVIDRLLVRPESDRDVSAVRTYYKTLPSLECVWSGKALSTSRFDVDHVIPFCLWHNNDLWNLLPADRRINADKKDKIITVKTLRASQERIIHYWHLVRQMFPERFISELGNSLLRERSDRSCWEKNAFSSLVETAETVAIQRGAERWQPN